MRKLLILGCLIFVSGCAKNGPSTINTIKICEPIYGRDSDWNVISDDLARNIYRHNRLCQEQ